MKRLRRLLIRVLGLQDQAEIAETLSYQNRTINRLRADLQGWEKRFKAADMKRLDGIEGRLGVVERALVECQEDVEKLVAKVPIDEGGDDGEGDAE